MSFDPLQCGLLFIRFHYWVLSQQAFGVTSWSRTPHFTIFFSIDFD
uniref:Uncharacterized protein n=1 Tax=Brassica oleracea TaxID=3712 RepID=A0A3P6DY36_BRAOL|nr:unnamed protein product [Brassica oleracea]